MIFESKITMVGDKYEYTINVFNCQNNKFGLNGSGIFELEITLTNETYPNGYKIYDYHYGEVMYEDIERLQDKHVFNMILSRFYAPINGSDPNQPVNVYEYSDDLIYYFYEKLHVSKVNNINGLDIFKDCEQYYEYINKMDVFIDNNLPFINKDIVDIRDCFMTQSSNNFYYSRYDDIHYVLESMEDVHKTESLNNIIVALYSEDTNLVFLYLMGPNTNAIYLGACTEKDIRDAGLSYEDEKKEK